jgi:hypothetical protein
VGLGSRGHRLFFEAIQFFLLTNIGTVGDNFSPMMMGKPVNEYGGV